VHRDLRDTPRMKAVLQCLSLELKAQASVLAPKQWERRTDARRRTSTAVK
jgi:hypothetical protein